MADIVTALIALEDGTASPLEVLETYGLLIKSGMISGLQGSHQRAAATLVRNGMLTEEGEITDAAIEVLETIPETEEY